MIWVEDPAASRQLKRTADCATHNLTRYDNTDINSNCKFRQKSKETRFSRNDGGLENKVAREKYHKIIFLVHSYKWEQQGSSEHAICIWSKSCTNTCNMQYASGINHVLTPATCNMHLVKCNMHPV